MQNCCLSLQNPLLDGGELTTYIGSIATKPGSADNSTSFTKWQKQGVQYNTPIIRSVCVFRAVIMMVQYNYVYMCSAWNVSIV